MCILDIKWNRNLGEVGGIGKSRKAELCELNPGTTQAKTYSVNRALSYLGVEPNF